MAARGRRGEGEEQQQRPLVGRQQEAGPWLEVGCGAGDEGHLQDQPQVGHASHPVPYCLHGPARPQEGRLNDVPEQDNTSVSTSSLACRALVTRALCMSLCLCLKVSKHMTTSPHTSTCVGLPLASW